MQINGFSIIIKQNKKANTPLLFLLGEQIAMNVDGSEPTGKAKKNYEPDEDKLFSSGIMDKQTLTSTKAVRDTSRYAVGILGKSHILIFWLDHLRRGAC